MKYPRLFIFALSALCTASLWAQDEQLFAGRDIMGTARYTAMAGAMASVGADPSAVLDNPAGLGLYKRMEISLSMQEEWCRNRHVGESSRGADVFSLPQVSLVFSLENRNETGGLRFNNFMFSFNRIKSFSRSTLVHGFNQPSISNLMLDQVTNPMLPESELSASGYNSPNTGWLSELGYWSYMIDPYFEYYPTDNPDIFDTVQTAWSSDYGGNMPQTALKLSESGYVDEYTLAWGANINHHWYVGAGLNIRSLYYTKSATYEEAFPVEEGENYTDYAQINSYVRQTGVGVSGSLGLIYQPCRYLRVGASFQTPTAMKISTTTHADIILDDAHRFEEIYKASTERFAGTGRLTQPMRLTLGATGLFGSGGPVSGLVSLQYDYRHQKDLQDVHTFRVGGELVLINNIFINAGYAFESTFSKADRIYTLARNDVRVDADFVSPGVRHFVGAGVGYRGNHFIAQLGYQYCLHNYNQYVFAPIDTQQTSIPDPFDMRNQTHRIVLTLAWHTKR